jgi:ribosomal protein S18 acetylase RimI-like enzyme
MERALAWIGAGVAVQLGVIHFNVRAIAFYKKWGFEDTGRIAGRHKIPRRLMVRPQKTALTNPPTEAPQTQSIP